MTLFFISSEKFIRKSTCSGYFIRYTRNSYTIVINCFYVFENLRIFCSILRDDDERRLHDLATKTKNVLKELADEVTKRKKELSRVKFSINLLIKEFSNL